MNLLEAVGQVVFSIQCAFQDLLGYVGLSISYEELDRRTNKRYRENKGNITFDTSKKYCKLCMKARIKDGSQVIPSILFAYHDCKAHFLDKPCIKLSNIPCFWYHMPLEEIVEVMIEESLHCLLNDLEIEDMEDMGVYSSSLHKLLSDRKIFHLGGIFV